MSYEAIVARIHTRPHPNADRLQLGTVCGHQVVVGLDTQDGDLGVFFPADGQLSEKMVVANGLYSKQALDKLGIWYGEGSGITHFGFFSDKRRVRAQSFRGQRSDGFWCPLSYVEWAAGHALGLLREGETFTALHGQEVCRKYETPATIRARNQPGRSQRENKCFPKHDVSKQFRYYSDSIPADAVLYVTEKLHGTSGRYGHVLDDVDLSWWRRLLNTISVGVWGGALPFPTRAYRYLNGSKNVILEKTTGAGYYGTNDFRYAAIENVTLHKGEILYFEIVGDVQAGQPIMNPQPIRDELKDLRKTYGETMRYRYGTAEGTCDIYVYKIVAVNEDGHTIDLPWGQVKARCSELGLKHVPEIAGPFTLPMIAIADDKDLSEMLAEMIEGPSTLDQGHIREGVVLRVESTRGIEYLKHKSWTFGVLEGYIKDVDSYVDTEEAA